jgi:hypothetical protein
MSEQKSTVSQIQQELQFRLASKDPRFFFQNLYFIPVIGVGAKLFELRPFQDEVLQTLIDEDLMIGLKARQIGMTTVTAGFAFWDAFFNENHPWLLISKNEDGAKKMLARILYAYDRLPKWLRERRGHRLVSRTQTLITFENGSSIEALPSVASTGRGDSVYGAVMDEFAFMDYASEVFAAVEPLVYGKMILISTANGMGNRFHEVWVDSSETDSPWRGMFFPWHVVPERDDAWYDRRWLKYRGQEWKFFQEYPSSPEEAFAKSGRVAFTYDLLKDLQWREPSFFEHVCAYVGGNAVFASCVG